MNISRRNATVILASMVSGNMSGCSGESDSKDTTPQSKSVKFAFDNSRNASTAWTDDEKLVLIGTGDFRFSGFKFERGRLSDGSTEIDFIVASPTKLKLFGTDSREVAVVDTSDATIKTISFLNDNIFIEGIGFYTKGTQTYVGRYNKNTTPTIDQLTDIRPIELKSAPSSSIQQPSTLARLLNEVIPSAHAMTSESDLADEAFKSTKNDILNWIPLLAATSLAVACVWKLSSHLKWCAFAWGATYFVLSGVFKMARADEAPPRLFLRELPPAGSIPYGSVIYVNDGGCPAGQLKMVTGGNQQLGIPRQIACIPTPPTVP